MERAPPTTQELPEPGDVLVGKYRVEATLRQGGMGAVFAAHHLVLDQRVAVKILLAQAAKEASTVERFLFEAQASARLASEHVARVIDAGELENGLPFLVMEYLDGCDLSELLVLNGPIAVPELADYMLQALAGIAHAHAADIIHRDLKPSNLFLALRQDGTHAIKILDFGISKSTSADSSGRYKSLTGKQVLGSPAYMSPEQVRNAKNVDVRSDIWSLGVVMYELASGAIPFDGDGVGEILAAILEANATPLHERRPEVPKAFGEAVMRCLKRDRDERFRTAADLAHAIAPFGTGKWAHIVESIAQTLLHSQQLKVATPFGAMRVPVSATPYGGPDVPTLAPPAPSLSRRTPEAIQLSLAATHGLRSESAPDTPPPISRASFAITQASSRKKRTSRVIAGLALVTSVACATAIAASWKMRNERANAASAAKSPTPMTTTSASATVASTLTATATQATATASAASTTTAPTSTSATALPHRPALANPARPVKPQPQDPASRPAILRSRD